MSVFIFPPVSVTTLPPIGGATASKQDAQTALLTSIGAKDYATQTTLAALFTELQLKADLTETQPVSLASQPLPSGASTEATLAALLTELQLKADLTETQPVSLASQPLPSGASTEAKQDTQIARLDLLATKAKQDAEAVLIGAVNETAPASDTASSGLNGRLQRVAQNISSLIAQIPASIGIKTAAGSLSITPASDAVFATKPKAITGTYAENLNLTTVATFIAPTNAIGAIIQADDTNAVNFRAKQGATATASSGIQFQPGRSEELKSGSDISVCSEGASVKVYVQWFVQA